MFASPAVRALSASVDDLEVGCHTNDLRLLVSVRDRIDAKLAIAVREFDEAGLWHVDGAASMRSWLVDEGMLGAEATSFVRTAQRFRALPGLAAAAVSGSLSRGQVRIVLSQITHRNEYLFADGEDDLVPALVGLSIAETDRVMLEWRARADAITDPDDRPEPELSLCHSQTIGGTWVTKGTFDPDNGSVIASALAAADSGDLLKPAGLRRAEALSEIAAFYLDHHDLDLPPRRKPHVSLIVDADHLERGRHADHLGILHPDTVARYLCDCSISRVVADKISGAVSQVLDLGRSTDVVSRAQRRALAVRDEGCRYPGCDRPVSWTDAHHIDHWQHGGPTDLANLVLLCRKHHTLVHRRHLHMKLRPDGVLEVWDEHHFLRESRPPGSLPDVFRQ